MAPPSLAARLINARFFRFCLTGAIGFGVDAAILLILVHGCGLSAIEARFASFACAVLVTFEVNRRWTFNGSDPRPYLSSLATYLGVQGLGFACNFIVYATLYVALRPSATAPIIALAIASAAALFINYLGALTVVFRRRSSAVNGAHNGQL